MYGHLKCFATSRHATRFDYSSAARMIASTVHHLVVPPPAVEVEGRDFAHERVRAHVVPPPQLRLYAYSKSG
jgi:hypothetical protein